MEEKIKVFVSYPDLRRYGIPWTRKHLTTMMKSGAFPKALQLSSRSIAWDADELREWINSRPVSPKLLDSAE